MTRRRITVVASEVLGAGGVGGAGTADSLLAVALGRAGHDVELLFARAEHVGTIGPEWQGIYGAAGVRVRQLEARSRVDPPYFTPTMDVLHALRDDPPELVIVNDWRGLGYAPLRARETGRGLGDTAFAIICHGCSSVLVEFSQKVPGTLERFAMDVLERTALGLADDVVSPSAWLLDWMRARSWPVPASASVVQYLSQATALGEEPPRAESGAPIRRLAFFGQMREGKGVRVLLSSLNALDPALLDGVELLFLGRVTRRWTPESVEAFLDPAVQARLASVRFETSLERSEALTELRVPGTLALMPSLLDNSPNTVSECVEQGIPLIASTAGGIPELVAEEDHARVLVAPGRADALAEALARALSRPDGFAPARPGRDPRAALDWWLEFVETIRAPRRPTVAASRPVVALGVSDPERTAPRESLVWQAREAGYDLQVAGSFTHALAAGGAEWVLLLDSAQEPDGELLEALFVAQAAADADVVGWAVRRAEDDGATCLFLGDAGSLGLVRNHYGVGALVRRASLEGIVPPDEGKPDPVWPVLAQLALSGARITTIPDPLATLTGGLGTVADVPGYGLEVLRIFERNGAPPDLPLLVTALGVETLSASPPHQPSEARSVRGLAARSRAVLEDEGAGAFVRRSLDYARRTVARGG